MVLFYTPPQVVPHLADGVFSRPCLLADVRRVLISLGLEGAGVGDVHGLPGDHHDAVGVPLVYHFSVDLRMK